MALHENHYLTKIVYENRNVVSTFLTNTYKEFVSYFSRFGLENLSIQIREFRYTTKSIVVC